MVKHLPNFTLYLIHAHYLQTYIDHKYAFRQPDELIGMLLNHKI